MSTQFTVIAGALAVLLVLVVLATLFLPRKWRLALYGTLIAIGAAVVGYVYFNTRFLPTELALQLVAEGLNQPVYALMSPDDSGRFFVVERAGTIRILQDGVVQERPFLDLTHRVESEGLEQGLLTMIFHPAYQENGFFYVFYSSMEDTVRLERYQVSAEESTIADGESGLILLEADHPRGHHSGAHLAFGPDGYLYLSIGDGLSNKEDHASQDRSNLLGDVLRLDMSNPAVEPGYQIPADNPFIAEAGMRPEIWAYGLRNPWRFDFDSLSGDLYLTDVGEESREEINYLPAGTGAGTNFGWRWYEGTKQVENMPGEAPPAEELLFPAAEYDHLALGGCAIVGGYVYRGTAIPNLVGKYLFGDYCSGFLWTLARSEDGQFEMERVYKAEQLQLGSFARDHEGELYLLDVLRGNMYKLVLE
jgi:glucose/arabinose dehydrogenase